jgi:hypothetical protein
VRIARCLLMTHISPLADFSCARVRPEPELSPPTSLHLA